MDFDRYFNVSNVASSKIKVHILWEVNFLHPTTPKGMASFFFIFYNKLLHFSSKILYYISLPDNIKIFNLNNQKYRFYKAGESNMRIACFYLKFPQ